MTEQEQTPPLPVWLQATLADVKQADLEAPIVGSSTADCREFSTLYRDAANAIEGDDQLQRSTRLVFHMLSAVTEMHFKPDQRHEPFGAMMTLGDGRRTAIPSDFRDRVDALAAVAERATNPVLRARLSDVCWLLDRKRAALGTAAAAAYSAIVREVDAGRLKFQYIKEESVLVPGVKDYLRRALQIGWAIGWDKPESRVARNLVIELRRRALEKQQPIPINWFSNLDIDFKVSDPSLVAADLENFLVSVSPQEDVHAIVRLWQLAAIGYRLAKKNDDKNRCHTEVAERLALHAETNSEHAFYAAQFLSDAISELNGIPGKRDRRTELRHRLVDIQTRIPEEMSSFSQEMDLSKIVEETQKSFEGKTLLHRLFAFAFLDRSPDPQKLIVTAKEMIEKHPLSSMFATSHVDRQGKVIHRSEGADLGGDGRSAIQRQIAQAESIRRHISVAGPIMAARQLILNEHFVSEDVFATLLQHSGFVPRELVLTFATGFSRFFQGDFISALYILTPLLENSLRYVLKQNGHDVSIFDDATQTQQDRTISALFEQMRADLDSIFTTAITTDIENVFLSKIGPHLRHSVAHGLLHDGDPRGTDAIYACWLIFRLCLLPLFPHREELAFSIH